RLALRGKDAADFVKAFNTFLVRAIEAGRRLVGMEKPKDVMSPRAQREHGFKVEHLPASRRASYANLYSAVDGQRTQDAFEERLRDNVIPPVPDQAAFRIDWPAWGRTRAERDRRIIDELMTGERRDFHDDWDKFCALPEGDDEPIAVEA